jgi:hypothetical protein
MPNANFNEWSPPSEIANLAHSWVTGSIPTTGSFISLKMKNGVIVPEFY